MNAEGWYLDPYGRHEQRWFSDGTATSLVRDNGVEADSAPPDEPVTHPLEQAPEGGVVPAALPADEVAGDDPLTVFEGFDAADLSTHDGEASAEGWFLDPYGRHEQRWFSNGTATSLVRDSGVEADSAPPDEPYREPLVPAPEHAADGSELLRADDAAAGDIDPTAPVRAALDSFGSAGVGQP